METNNKRVTETIKTTELPENIDNNNKEEFLDSNIEDRLEANLGEIWNRIGGMTMLEGAKSAWYHIKNLKIKHIAIGIGTCIGLVLVGFMICGVIHLIELAWVAANNCFTMTSGEHFVYLYSLIDRDLFYSIPFCLLVAAIVGIFSERHELLYTLLYFLTLLFIIEIWDYWHVEYTANEILGELCFVIMFIIVPVLSMVRYLVSIFTDNEHGNEAKEDD